MWLYGQGKPACQDISKGIDRLLGAKREKVRYPRLDGFHETDGPIPVTPEAAAWLGYGTALKPAWEAVVVAMKPIEGSYAKNALKWGVAGLNIDESRIPCDAKATFPVGKYHADRGMYGSPFRTPDPFPNGRFPANVILDEEAGRLLDAQGPISKGGKYRKSGHRNLRHRGNLLYGGGIGGGPQMPPIPTAMRAASPVSTTAQRPVRAKGMRDWRASPSSGPKIGPNLPWACGTSRASSPNRTITRASSRSLCADTWLA